MVSSTRAAEHLAARWLRALLQALAKRELPPTGRLMDNTAAIEIARMSAKTRQSKYISVRYHHPRDSVEKGDVSVMHQRTYMLAADAVEVS